MKPTAQQLNEWLSANHQDAINAFEQQGMTLRFVDGPENYHQDWPSLAVGAEGVGFTFQTNHQWHSDPRQLVSQALDRAPAFQQAFSAARQQYGDKPLPIAKPPTWATPLVVRGQDWDIANHQPETTTKTRQAQQNDWLRHGSKSGYEDVADLVGELCERQAFFDRLRTPEGVLSLVRGPDTLTFNEDLDIYALNADPRCGFMFEFHEGGDGCAVNPTAFYEDPDYGRMYCLHDKSRALLSAGGIRYETDGFDNLTPTLTAKDLNMDPVVMNTMADMGMAPLDILRFDVQKAEAESSAGEEYLQSMDGDIFASQESDQGFML